MLISYNWLKNYVSTGDQVQVETILERLTLAGVSVEGVRHLGRDITGVVVAELLSVEKHPQADRLSLTRVSDGKETYQVVCGARNIAPGQKLPLAKVGAVLPGDFKIKAAKIRGVESFGMLCSAKELGLAEDAEGILILPPDAPLGSDFLSYMELPDTLFELEITPNRADLLSHLGVAREIGAVFHKPVKPPKVEKLPESDTPLSKLAQVSIEAKDLCPLYTCRVIEGVQVGPSPLWLSRTLERLGQRSINNVVDVTNYVLHEMGQPLHAFDLDELHDRRVTARRAKAGEKIPLLDNTVRDLKEYMLVIADADRPVALAGIMGGGNSQVTGKTRNILLESALFLPGSVRKTARQLGLSTDSSYRFERGVDPEGVKAALERAASLIVETAGGRPAKGLGEASSVMPKPSKIHYRPKRANAVLGLELPAREQWDILIALGCTHDGSNAAGPENAWPPSFRLDLTREIDLIEEVARLTGYDRIPAAAPRIPSDLLTIESGIPFEKEIRFIFHRSGLHEAVSSTFLPADFPRKLRLEEGHALRRCPEVTNPIADDQRVLRPTLLPSLLSAVQLNLSHQLESACLYELDKVFGAPGPGGLPAESLQAAAVLAGAAPGAGWHSPERPVDFYDIKGLSESLLTLCGLKGLKWEFDGLGAPYAGGRTFRVLGPDGAPLAWGGAVHPKVLKEYGVSAPCFALEVEVAALAKAPRTPASYAPLPKFPAAWRDIALVVPDGVTSAQVAAAIEEQGKPELKNILLFDLYRGPHLPSGFRSLAYRLQFLNEERTLTDQEVTQKVSRIVDQLKSRYSIALR